MVDYHSAPRTDPDVYRYVIAVDDVYPVNDPDQVRRMWDRFTEVHGSRAQEVHAIAVYAVPSASHPRLREDGRPAGDFYDWLIVSKSP